jgi:hypothetical protein
MEAIRDVRLDLDNPRALQDRVREIDDERRRLEGALKALTGADGRARRTPQRRRRRQAPRGQRRAQALEMLEKAPGLRPRDLAKEHGISNSQASTLLRQLVESGEATKRKDGRYYPKRGRAAKES